MKYGLKETPGSPQDDVRKSPIETSILESKIEAVVVTPNENVTESSIASPAAQSNETAELDSISAQLPINEPTTAEQIIPEPIITPEKIGTCESSDVPILSFIHTELPKNYVNQTIDQGQSKYETTAMICDVITTNDAATLQESVMEVAISNENETLEVEMGEEPTTPSDIDMTGNIDVQDSIIESYVNYNLKNAPIIELSRYSWGTNEQKYLRGCIFSPDGTCILTTVNKDGMHIIELPLSLYENESVSADRPLDVLTTAVHVPEGGTVYDFCWYPFMNSTAPETCCFLSTRQHEPIQLWDAFDGKLRCTYRGYDAVDEVDSALSICFSIDGSQVIAGYRKTVKIFRTDVPGRDYTNFTIKSPASCLAINATDENMIAIGSWNSFVTFHDVRTPKLTITEKLVKHTGGVTLMKFSLDGNRLFTGARKDNKLLAWDVRNVTVPLFTLNRNVETNQKIYFDLSSSGQWLVSGDTKGILHVYDVEYGTQTGKFPDYQYQLHRDCCNGVSLHPTRPIFATASGQHHFIGIDEDIALKSAEMQENSLIFWWCGKSD